VQDHRGRQSAGELTLKVHVTDDPSMVSVDLVLFCVKTHDTDTAAHAMRPLVGHDTFVLPLQNGIESADRIARIIGQGHVLGGTTYVSSKLESPGVIKRFGTTRPASES
jgi:2-dehydropantoate 2-reductase